MPESLLVADWPAFVDGFLRFFEGAGSVEVSDERVTFSSQSPATGLSVDRTGRVAGSMPLHAVESVARVAVFDPETDEIRFRGDGFAYTYRVPAGLRR
jgi:hypothetical protein